MSGRSTSAATKEELLQGIIDSTPSAGQFNNLTIDIAPVDGVNAVQTATISGTPAGGTFNLTFGGLTTSNLAHNASAAAVQSALEALSSIGSGNVTVSGSAGGPYTITFTGSLAGQPQALITAAHAFTGGSSPDIEVETTTAGVTGSLRGVAGPGAFLSRTDTPHGYINKGSLYKPAWKQITTA